MTRISENQTARGVLYQIYQNRKAYAKFSNEVSSGLKVVDPGDSRFSGTIAQYRETLQRIEGHRSRIKAIEGVLSFQDNTMTQMAELLVRAREVAAQAGNEINGPDVRAQMAKEVWELRDQVISLANSKYQGKYVYGGLDDDDAPFGAAAYTEPASGRASERWVYDDTTIEPGNALTRSVNITEDLSIIVNTPGSQLFSNAIFALERLGRALEGYRTEPATGAPDGTGTAFVLPDELAQQTDAIENAMDLLEQARVRDIMPERVSLGARLKRLQTADALLDLTKQDAEAVLAELQAADIATSATNLTQAQTALEASYTVNSRILTLTILDFL